MRSCIGPIFVHKQQQRSCGDLTVVCGGFWELLTRVQLVIALEIVDCGQKTANNWHQHEGTEEPWKHWSWRWTVLLQTEFCLWKNWRRKTSKYNEMKTVVMCGSLKTLPWKRSNCCRNNSGNVSDVSRKDQAALISTLDEDGEMQRFPPAVGRVCCHILRLSGKVYSFFPCCWLRRQGKQPLWQSGLELYTKHTLPPCCN